MFIFEYPHNTSYISFEICIGIWVLDLWWLQLLQDILLNIRAYGIFVTTSL